MRIGQYNSYSALISRNIHTAASFFITKDKLTSDNDVPVKPNIEYLGASFRWSAPELLREFIYGSSLFLAETEQQFRNAFNDLCESSCANIKGSPANYGWGPTLDIQPCDFIYMFSEQHGAVLVHNWSCKNNPATNEKSLCYVNARNYEVYYLNFEFPNFDLDEYEDED